LEKPFALIIEDERDVAALLRHVMDMVGYRTEVTLNGGAGMERLSNSRPDLVLLDLNLPGVSGTKILEMIRKDQRLRLTKVIVITAHAQIAEGLSVEPDLILQKPLSIEHFSVLMQRFHEKMKYQKTVPLKDEPWDRVTGLYNQSFFKNRLHFALMQSKEHAQYLFAVISLTLDQDDSVKNRVDIKRWISILQETANILKGVARSTDTIARFHQDQFYVLIENIANNDIPEQIASRIYDRLNEHLENLGSEMRFPVQLGIILCDRKYENIEQILQDVNTAKSLANSQGGICYKDFGELS